MTTYAIVRNYIKKKNRLKTRIYRTPIMSAFSLEEDEFKKLYHVSKEIAKLVLDTLRPHIEPKSGIRTAISAESKVLCALRYFASGLHQRKIGEELLVALSQPAVSRAVASVSEAICKCFRGSITFPRPDEYEQVKKYFSDIGGFPGVIGIIGCNHIPIPTPPDNDPTTPQHAFLNPKGRYSINTLFVSDGKMKICYVNAQYPGASVDWFVWRHSKLRSKLEEQMERNPDSWLLGTNNFQPEPWLLTPFKESSTEAEKAYNICHQNTWNAIRKCIHRLKLRFGLLHRGVLHHPSTTKHIIKACAILHNLCLVEDSDDEDFFLNLEVDRNTFYNIEIDDPIEELNYCEDVYVPIDESTIESAMLQRNCVLQNYFSA